MAKFRVLLLAVSITQTLCVGSVFAQDVQKWEAMMQAGDSAAQSGNHDAAKVEYTKALQESQKFGSNSWRVARTLLELGSNILALGEQDEAKPLLERALKIYENAKEVGPNHFEVSRVLYPLGNIARRENDLAQAQKCYQRALIIRKATLGPTHPELATLLCGLAAVKLEYSQYKEAEQLYKEALKVTGPNAPKDIHYSCLLGDIAVCYKRQGKYAEAEPLYKEALEIVARKTGTNSLYYLITLHNLAVLTAETGRLDDAQKMYEQCLSIADQKTTGRINLQSAGLAHLGLGEIAYRRHNYTEAEIQYKWAWNQLQDSIGQDHPDTLLALSGLIDAYEQLNKLKEATQLLRTQLAVNEKLHGQSSPVVAADVSRLVQLLLKQGSTAEASVLQERANKIKASLPGSTNLNAPQIKIGAPSPAVGGKIKDKWAVVIGISEFKDNGLNLKYAAKDALDFKNYLIRDAHFQPDHVKLLLNKGANRQSIVSTLGEGWLGRLANRDDMVVIFISTHGTKASEEAAGTNFIVPYDCNVDDFLLSGIPMQWFTAGIGKMVHANRLVFILDVCHAGATATSAKGITRSSMLNPDAITLGTGQVLLASSNSDQSSWESRTYANSVFTYRLMEALRMNGSNMIKAYQQMRPKVEQEVLRDRGKLQTPILIKRWSGEDPNLGVSPVAPRSATLSK